MDVTDDTMEVLSTVRVPSTNKVQQQNNGDSLWGHMTSKPLAQKMHEQFAVFCGIEILPRE